MQIKTSTRPFALALSFWVGAIVFSLTTSASAEVPDWGDVSEVETVVVITENEDGAARETTIWLVMTDGNAYIRTSKRSAWGKNVARNPAITLRVEGRDHPVSVTFVDDADEYGRVKARFRNKYGFEDAFIGIIRGSKPPIMRLDSREGLEGNAS